MPLATSSKKKEGSAMINSSHPPEEQHKDTENELLPEEIHNEISRLSKELEEGFPLDDYPDAVQNIIKDK